MIKKLYAFAVICAYLFGSISALGWTLYNHAWAAAIGCLCVSAMAYPYARKQLNELM